MTHQQGHSVRPLRALWMGGFALAGILLAQPGFAQNGSPLPFNGGNIQGLPPTHPGQTWPGIQSPAGNLFVPSATNPFAPTVGSALDRQRALGKALFWDEQVSSDNTMACGTCHGPNSGGIDPRGGFLAANGADGSLGMIPQDSSNNYRQDVNLQQDRRVTGFNPPSTVTGAAFKSSGFWDGRAGPEFDDSNGVLFLSDFAALEAQAVQPPTAPTEMCRDGLVWVDNSGATPVTPIKDKLGPARPLAFATNVPADLANLVAPNSTYDRAFDEAFGVSGPGVTRERFAMAIATYERTLVPNKAPIDTRDLFDPPAPQSSEKRGFDIFINHNCIGCHSSATGPVTLLSGGGFSNPFDSMLSDGQRKAGIGVPGADPFGGFLGAVTPSLRNVALKSQFFANGSIKDLDTVISFYNAEGSFNPLVGFQSTLSTQQKADIKAFFEALTDPRVANETFPFDRPTLYSERVPYGLNEFGVSTPAAGPDILANVPLKIGDPHFKLGFINAPILTNGRVGLLTATGAGPVIWVSGLQAAGSTFTTDANGIATIAFPNLMPSVLIGSALHAQAQFFTSGSSTFSNAAAFRLQ